MVRPLAVNSRFAAPHSRRPPSRPPSPLSCLHEQRLSPHPRMPEMRSEDQPSAHSRQTPAVRTDHLYLRVARTSGRSETQTSTSIQVDLLRESATRVSRISIASNTRSYSQTLALLPTSNGSIFLSLILTTRQIHARPARSAISDDRKHRICNHNLDNGMGGHQQLSEEIQACHVCVT